MRVNLLNKLYLLVVVLVAMMLHSCGSTKRQVKGTEYKNENIVFSEKNVWGGKLLKYGIDKADFDNDSLYIMAEEWIGTPYLYGGNTRKGVDCSGFVVQVYLNVYGKKLERNSAMIFQKNCEKTDKSDLKEGDLVFFSNARNRKINHVGIYLKGGKFVHASSKGVVVDSLSQPYYEKNYIVSGKVK